MRRRITFPSITYRTYLGSDDVAGPTHAPLVHPLAPPVSYRLYRTTDETSSRIGSDGSGRGRPTTSSSSLPSAPSPAGPPLSLPPSAARGMPAAPRPPASRPLARSLPRTSNPLSVPEVQEREREGDRERERERDTTTPPIHYRPRMRSCCSRRPWRRRESSPAPHGTKPGRVDRLWRRGGESLSQDSRVLCRGKAAVPSGRSYGVVGQTLTFRREADR